MVAVLFVALLVSVSAGSLVGASAATTPSIEAASTPATESTSIDGATNVGPTEQEPVADPKTNPTTANASPTGSETETYLLVLDKNLTANPTQTGVDIDQTKHRVARAQAPVVDRLEANGIQITRQFWITNAIVTTVNPDDVTPADLRAIDGVTRVEPNVEFQRPDPQVDDENTQTGKTTTTTDGIGETTYGLNQINVDGFVDAYDTNGSDTRVAIIDDGLNESHPDINVTLGVNVSGGTVSDPTTTTLQQDTGHGDHVAGTATGTRDPAGDVARYSVAPDAELLKADVFVGGATLADIIAAIEWAVEEDADVVSMSLGVSVSDTDSTIVLSVEDAIQNANNAGTVVIGSAGNAGTGATGGPVGSPGTEFSSASVGATNSTGDVPPFSSGAVISSDTTVVLKDGSGVSAPYPDHYPHAYVKPDITAPGVSILSAGPLGTVQPEDPRYSTASGTSMAAPHVAGAVALLQSSTTAHREPHVLINALAETARKPDGTSATSRDIRYGMGGIDVLAARNALNSTTPIDGTVTGDGNTLTGAAITTDSGVISTTNGGTYAIEPTTDATTVGVTANEYGYVPETTSVTTGGSETLAFDLAKIESIDVKLNTTRLKAGSTANLSVIASHPDGTESDITEEATVTSSNTAVATSNGTTVSGDSAGTTTITARYDGFTDEQTVEVVELETISLDLAETAVTTGQSVTATVTGTYTDGTNRTLTNNATITARDTDIATVDNTTITGLSSGTTTITATVEDKTATADLTVLDPAFFDVNVTQIPSSVIGGESLTLAYTVTNTGERIGTQNVTVSINGSEQKNETLQLNPEMVANETVTYQTQSGETPNLNVTVASANATVTKKVEVQTAPRFVIAIDSIDDTVVEGETITAAYTVTNTGDVAGTQSVSLRVNGTEQNTTRTTLAAGATTNSTLRYQTQPGDAPTLNISIASADTTVTKNVTVDAPATFTIAIDENTSTRTVTEPDSIVVAADIKNVGTSAGTESITYTLTREKNTTAATNTTNITLAGRTATTVRFTTPTTDLELGEYVATVDSETDTSTQNITLEPAQTVEEDTGGSGGGGGGGQPSLADSERENFTIRSSHQSATEIQQGESISVSAEIENTGDKGGQQIQLLLNGTQRATKTVLLQPGETRTVTFDDITVDEPAGEYTYQIVTNDDTAEGTITVSTDNSSDTAAPETTTGENDTATTDSDTNGSNTTRDSQSERESPETTDESPGFGLSVAIVSLLLVAGLLRGRS